MTDHPPTHHPPIRPGYDCARCGLPWPCAPARWQLAEHFAGDPAGLGVLLSGHMREALGEAITDHDWGRVDNLYDRFLGWQQHPTHPDH